MIVGERVIITSRCLDKGTYAIVMKEPTWYRQSYILAPIREFSIGPGHTELRPVKKDRPE
jgi:hypothetical protein